MRMSHWWRLLLIGLPMLLALALARPAVAAQPDFTIIPVDDTSEVPALTEACGFTVLSHGEGTLKIAAHVDQAGNLTRVMLTSIRWKVSFTNAATGTTVATASPLPVTLKYESDGSVTMIRRGLLFHIGAPGEGLILQEAGKIVVDEAGNILFKAGPHPILEGNLAPLCAALAGS